MNAPPLAIPSVASWPEPPRRWSHTSLVSVEACPLRWALSRATYADGSQGFPERPREATLQGQVVHLAVEQILGALAAAGCSSVSSPEAARVLLALEGVTAIVGRCVESVLADLPANDRAVRGEEALARGLWQAIPALRDRVGLFVRRARLGPRSEVLPPRPRPDGTLPARRPLGPGSYTEVWIECADPPLGGFVDLLTLRPDAVEIVDIKTGNASAAHADQLVTYGVVWHLDAVLNPTGRVATSLTLLYPGEMTPVTLPDWSAAANALTLRTQGAVAAVTARPIPAKPSVETCRWCAAKPTCQAYWNADLWSAGTSGAGGNAVYLDVALFLDREVGPDLWSVSVRACPSRPHLLGPAMLVSRGGDALAAGTHVRVLGARLLETDSNHPGVVISTSGSAEIFLVTNDSDPISSA